MRKVAKHNKCKTAQNLVIFKVKKIEKKCLKKPETVKYKYKTAPDLLAVNRNVIKKN